LIRLLLIVWTGLIGRLSYPATRRLGRWLGLAAYYLRTPPARITRINIRNCFPALTEEEQTDLVRSSLIETGRLLAEAGIVFHWNEDRLNSLITGIDGFDPLQQALDQGRGILVLAPHFGNWELFALHFGHYGFLALYDPPKNRSLEQLVVNSRQRTGAVLLPIGRRGIRRVLATLQAGDPVSILPDQVPGRNAGIYAPFFDRPALTMRFAHRLICGTNPLVVLGACTRSESGFRVSFSEVPDAIYAADPEQSAVAMNQAIERLVRTAPAQYQWEYKRFKRPPPGEPDPYSF
jgi:KDO2-lipid IV(A) lauroyltransferase